MGFIERLKSETDSKEQQRLQREQQLRAAKQAENVAQEQKEAQEREYHAERRKHAEVFHGESGIGNLVTKLKTIISATGGSVFSRVDLDSVVDAICWDRQVVSSGTRSGGLGGIDYGTIRERHLAVETCPDGTIKFHGGLFGGSKISLVQWRNDKSVLEDGLEKAYKRHFVKYSSYQSERHVEIHVG